MLSLLPMERCRGSDFTEIPPCCSHHQKTHGCNSKRGVLYQNRLVEANSADTAISKDRFPILLLHRRYALSWIDLLPDYVPICLFSHKLHRDHAWIYSFPTKSLAQGHVRSSIHLRAQVFQRKLIYGAQVVQNNDKQ